MRAVIQGSGFPDGPAKFNSGHGDITFTIVTNSGDYIVDIYGNVISPVGGILNYTHNDLMTGNQSGITAPVKDFLTVDPTMDSPGSRIW